jgi:hypothetical protein
LHNNYKQLITRGRRKKLSLRVFFCCSIKHTMVRERSSIALTASHYITTDTTNAYILWAHILLFMIVDSFRRMQQCPYFRNDCGLLSLRWIVITNWCYKFQHINDILDALWFIRRSSSLIFVVIIFIHERLKSPANWFMMKIRKTSTLWSNKRVMMIGIVIIIEFLNQWHSTMWPELNCLRSLDQISTFIFVIDFYLGIWET